MVQSQFSWSFEHPEPERHCDNITLFFVFSGDFIDKYTLLQLPQHFLMKLQTDILIRQQMLTEIKQKSHYLQSVRLLSSRNLLKIYI